MKTIKMEDMNWPDIKSAIEGGFTTIIIGVGSTEQHGPHLPLKTDSAIADAVVIRVAMKLKNCLVAPTIRVGCSEHHLAFPGTISLQPSTLESIMLDYVESLHRHGFKTIIFIPTHGGNFSTVQRAIDNLKKKHPDLEILEITDLFGFIEPMYNIAEQAGLTRDEGGAHAGEIETSMMLAIDSNRVVKDRFEPGYLGHLGEKELKVIIEKGMTALTRNGILGDPSKADLKRGNKYLDGLAEYLVSEIKKQL